MTTPLIESISLEKYEIMAYLLQHGADPNLRAGFSNDVPITVARKNKNKKDNSSFTILPTSKEKPLDSHKKGTEERKSFYKLNIRHIEQISSSLLPYY